MRILNLLFSRNKKNNVYPCKPQFNYTKVAFKGGSKLYRRVFVMKISSVSSAEYAHKVVMLNQQLSVFVFLGTDKDMFYTV